MKYKKLKIFLIIGDARSGNTFLANQIVKNLNILVIPETNFITRLFRANKSIFNTKRELIEFLYREKKFSDLKIKKKELHEYISNYQSIKQIIIDVLKTYYDKNCGLNYYIGIKKGSLMFYLKQFMDLFPDTKIFNIIRDGRAVYHSKKNSIYSQTGLPFLTNPYEAAKIWNKKVDIMLGYKNSYNIETLVYEKFIKDISQTLNKISKVLKLNLKKKNSLRKKNYYVSNIYDQNLHININSLPDIKLAYKWRKGLTDHEICCFEFFAKKNLKRFGYILTQNRFKFLNYTYIVLSYLKFLCKVN
jgi:hypothetical protein